MTGETKAYSPSAINNEVGGFNAPVPSRPFSLSGDSWGAWELVARYSDTNLNWHTSQTRHHRAAWPASWAATSASWRWASTGI